MMAVPHRGFVFLAMPKCASSSIEPRLHRRAMISMPRHPALKHMPAADFERLVAPLLERAEYPRSSYETVCLFREPIEWLHSWWRYRSRDELAGPKAPGHENYTGRVTFEEFADAHIGGDAPYARLAGQADFVRGPAGEEVGVDRIFRYEDTQRFVAFITERLNDAFELDHRNVSPWRAFEVSPRCRERLSEHLQVEYRIYDDLAP